MPSDVELNDYMLDNCVIKVTLTLREYANIFGEEAAAREYVKQHCGEYYEE